MATKGRTKPTPEPKSTREHATDFPGAMNDKFGNQYFEKQGTEHSSRPPYQHDEQQVRHYEPAGDECAEKCDEPADRQRHESSNPPYTTHPSGKPSVGNKDEYQAGDATKR